MTLEDRLTHGNITILELVRLSGRCRAVIYKDIRAGLLRTVKFGTAYNSPVFVRGPDARAYIAGELHAGVRDA